MAAMLEEQNNKNYLHKNKTFFPSIKFLSIFFCQISPHDISPLQPLQVMRIKEMVTKDELS